MGALTAVLVVGAGGFVGANARYWLALWAARRWGTEFPWGTLLINVSGSFILGLFTTLALRFAWSDAVRVLIGVGFVGAFTTFSTFEYETLQLAVRGQYGRAALYIAGSLAVGFAAVCLGAALGRLGGKG